MAKNTLGAIWRDPIEHLGRSFYLVVTHDGQGSCSVVLTETDEPILETEVTVTSRSLDDVGRPMRVSSAIVGACQDDLTDRLKAGEFDALLK